MGVSVREKDLGSGVWWVFISHNGKRRSKKIGRDKKIAQDIAKKLEAKLVLGDFDIDNGKKKMPLFGDCSQKWLQNIAANRRQSTFERYSQVLRDHVYPVFKNKYIDQITRGEIKDLLSKKSNDGMMNIEIIRDVISGVMIEAIDDEIITTNPVIGIIKKLNIKKDQTKEVEPLNENELDIFLQVVHECMPAYYPFFLTASRTGLRMGELLALQWGDIQFMNLVEIKKDNVVIVENRPYIYVQRSYRRGITGTTKNGKFRNVEMSNQLASTLKEYQSKKRHEAFLNGQGEIQELVFHDKAGKIFEQNFIRRIFERALLKAGIRKIKFHGLRHTFAGLLLSKGESIVYVKEQLGHSSINITVDIYGKLIPTSRMVGVNRLDTQHLSAPQLHPAKTEKVQHIDVTPHINVMVPKVGIEPTRAQSSLDFESSASTSFTTPA